MYRWFSRSERRPAGRTPQSRSSLDDDFPEPLARQKEFHALELTEQLFQTPIVVKLRGPSHALLQDLERVQLIDAESVGGNFFLFVVGVEERQHVGLRP